MKTFIYGLTFALAVFLGLYYNLIAVKQIAINYDYTMFFFHNYITQPLFYCSLAALIAELSHFVGWLHLPQKARNVCLLLAVVLLVLYLVLLLALFATNITIPLSIGLLIISHPQIFLVHGVLLALGSHKESPAANG